MKHTIVPGGEIETVTPAELDSRFELLLRHLESDEDFVRVDGTLKLDAGGNGVLEVYTVPPGMKFNLHVVVLDADGFSPGAPFTNAAGWVDVNRSGEREAFLPLSAAAGGLPAAFTRTGSTAIRYRNGEQVEIAFNGGPANGSVRAKVQGELSPIESS